MTTTTSLLKDRTNANPSSSSVSLPSGVLNTRSSSFERKEEEKHNNNNNNNNNRDGENEQMRRRALSREEEDDEEDETEEEEEECESDWSQDDPFDASNSFLTKIVRAHKKAIETSEEERRRLKALLFKAEDRCEELLELNENLERRLERREATFTKLLEEERMKAERFPEREAMEAETRKLKSDLEAVKSTCESLERRVNSLKIREREQADALTKLRDETAKMKSSGSSDASGASSSFALREARRCEEEKEKQTLAVIAETYAMEIRKLKEKVELYEKARVREKTYGGRSEKTRQREQQQYFSFGVSEDVEEEEEGKKGNEDDEVLRPPPTVAKRLPSDSESPFGTLNSEGRMRAAISRLGILDDNGDVPKKTFDF